MAEAHLLLGILASQISIYCPNLKVFNGLTALLAAQLAAVVKVADAAELPLVVLRRATVPVLDPEFYSRHWFLASLVGLVLLFPISYHSLPVNIVALASHAL